MRILIAEDDLTSRTVLANMLKKQGYEVTATVDGAQAWQAMQQPDAPKLAIVDWMMPEMDGLEVVRLVRTLQTEQPPHIIMLTGKGEKADIIAGLDAGANDYLLKPFDPGELRARVNVGRRMVEMQDVLIKSRGSPCIHGMPRSSDGSAEPPGHSCSSAQGTCTHWTPRRCAGRRSVRHRQFQTGQRHIRPPDWG